MPSYTIRDNKTNEPTGPAYTNYYAACDGLALIGPNWQRTHYLHNDNWRDDWRRVTTLDLSEFGFEAIKDHFLLIDEENSLESVYVTYFVDEWAGAKGRRSSPTKLGRYLKQFYPQLTDDDVTTQSTTIFNKLLKVELQLAYSADDIQSIYEESHDGPVGSCMSHPIDSGHWNSWMKDHPTRAYAGPDLALAYIRDPDGELIGRGLVWPEKMIYGSLYGNYDKMRAALTAAGYTKGGFEGARMTRLPQRRHSDQLYLACPYLDDTGVCYDNGEYLVMGRKEGFDRKEPNTGGYISIYEYKCAVTGDTIPTNKLASVLAPYDGYEKYIHADLRDEHTEYHNGSYWLKTDNENDYMVVNGDVRLPRGVITHFYRKCVISQEYHLTTGGGVSTHLGWVSNKHFYTDFVVCQATRAIVLKTEAKWMEHGAWWHPSALREQGVTIEGKNYARVLQQLAA
ncbi:hypothetical protein NKJ88_05820 [Mesorhizobium sp. M0016]|uniref:hypothetical protein n=1 Tax=Mesorhizobium sp. M0016 TaxID=2956843 RepID=UPI0033388820